MQITIALLLATAGITWADSYEKLCKTTSEYLPSHSFGTCANCPNNGCTTSETCVGGDCQYGLSGCYDDDKTKNGGLQNQADCEAQSKIWVASDQAGCTTNIPTKFDAGQCEEDSNGAFSTTHITQAACETASGFTWKAAVWSAATWTTAICSDIATSAFGGVDWATVGSCADFSTNSEQQKMYASRANMMAVRGCCGVQQKSICWEDRSGFCMADEIFTGSNLINTDGAIDKRIIDSKVYYETCDSFLSYWWSPILETATHTWPNYVCADNAGQNLGGLSWMPAVTYEGFIRSACCSGGKSKCWRDNSNVCKVPANYVGELRLSTYTCDTLIDSMSRASGYGAGGGAGPLFNVDLTQTYDCTSSSVAIKDAITEVAEIQNCCSGNTNADVKSACWTPPPDNSHVCKIAANYRGDHVPEGNPPQNTCDAFIATYSVDSGFPGGGAGPFNGIDFSQPYDCSASSDAIKSSVNLLGSTLAGCCGANGGAPESACFVAPSGICLTDADWTGTSTLNMCVDSGSGVWFGKDQSSCTAACRDCPDGATCNDQSSCTGGTCQYDGHVAGTDIDNCMKDSNGATTTSQDNNVKGRCYTSDGNHDASTTSQGACSGGSNWYTALWKAATWTTLSWVPTTCSHVGAEAVRFGGNDVGPLDFATATCSDVNPQAKAYVNLAVDGGCCGSEKKSICWTEPVDNSYVCAIPANYQGNYDVSGTGAFDCDTYIASVAVASGYQGGGAGPLNNVDLSQTYDCTSSSNVIKEQINNIAQAGCCSGNNDGAPKSTCSAGPAVDNSFICKTPAQYDGQHRTNALAFGGPDADWLCDGIVSQTLSGIDFSSTYDCSQTAADVKTKIEAIASGGCCGNNGQSVCAVTPATNSKCATLTGTTLATVCKSTGALKAAYCKNCDAKNNNGNGKCATTTECTASLGQCVVTATPADRIMGVTDEASCTGTFTDRTWKPAVWTTSATTECAGATCGAVDATTCCSSKKTKSTATTAPSPAAIGNAPSPATDDSASESSATATIQNVFAGMITFILAIWLLLEHERYSTSL